MRSNGDVHGFSRETPTRRVAGVGSMLAAAGIAVSIAAPLGGCVQGSDTARYNPPVRTAGPSIYGPGPREPRQAGTTIVAIPFDRAGPQTAANFDEPARGPVAQGPTQGRAWGQAGGFPVTDEPANRTPVRVPASPRGEVPTVFEGGKLAATEEAATAPRGVGGIDTTTGDNEHRIRPLAPSESWNLNAAAVAAEAEAPQSAVLPVAVPGQMGANMAARLYGDVLETEIPEIDGPDGFNTINIRQATFTHDGSVFDATVSADGRWLLFASTQHSKTSDLYAQPVGSRVVTRLTTDPSQDIMPSISPDGERIAFASDRNGNWDIWVMPSAGGKAMQITSGPVHDLHPSWSPDGTHLVFCRLGEQSGRWELWTVDVANLAQTQFIGYGLFPEWCPVPATGFSGGDQILFQRSRERGERTFAVWTIEYNRGTQQAGNEAQIISNPAAALINPNWSPDGRFVTYAAIPNPERWVGEGLAAVPPSASIWMIGADGTNEVPLTRGTSVDMMPTWSSRGEIFFVSNRAGAENLWSVQIGPAMYAALGDQPEGVRSAFADGAVKAGPTRTAERREPRGRAPLEEDPVQIGPGTFVTAPTGQP